jgi:hypothetical protein
MAKKKTTLTPLDIRQRYVERKRERLVRSGAIDRSAGPDVEHEYRDARADYLDPDASQAEVKAEIARWQRERENKRAADDGYRQALFRSRIAEALQNAGDPGRTFDPLSGHSMGPLRGFNLMGDRIR